MGKFGSDPLIGKVRERMSLELEASMQLQLQPGQDLYLRLPPNAPSANPNDLYITAGGSIGLALSGPQMRVSGFEIRQVDEEEIGARRFY